MNSGDLIENPADELFIQIPAHKILGGSIGSDNFRPRSIDDGKKSMDWSGKTTFEEAKKFHLDQHGVTGGACTAVVEDFTTEDIPVIYDPITAPVKNDAHCVGDYSGLNNSRQKNAAKKLKRKIAKTLIIY